MTWSLAALAFLGALIGSAGAEFAVILIARRRRRRDDDR